MPSGFSTDEKKALAYKVTGGNLYDILHNQYLNDAQEEAKKQDAQYKYRLNCQKLDYSKFFHNRAQDLRVQYNLRKI